MSDRPARRDAPTRTPFADACRAVANMLVEDLKPDPEDTVPLALAKTLALDALAGKVHAASELADRAEGRPAQTVVQQSDSPHDAFTSTIRIALARCEAYGMEPPEFLVAAAKLIDGDEPGLDQSEDKMQERNDAARRVRRLAGVRPSERTAGCEVPAVRQGSTSKRSRQGESGR